MWYLQWKPSHSLILNFYNNIFDQHEIFKKSFEEYDCEWINSTKIIVNEKDVFKRNAHRNGKQNYSTKINLQVKCKTNRSLAENYIFVEL